MISRIRVGIVPSYREMAPFLTWVHNMRESLINILSSNHQIELFFPKPTLGGSQCSDSIKGLTPNGCVCNLDQADAISEYFKAQNIDALIISPLNFGDERSAIKIAERLEVPVFLYATKEPEVSDTPSMARISDSYCGTLSIAAGLHRRGLYFYFGGIFFHEDIEFINSTNKFFKAVAVRKALMNTRIGQIGVRPQTFETVTYNEIELSKKFKQNVIFTEVSDIVEKAKIISDDDPNILRTITDIKSEVKRISISQEWITKAAKLEKAISDYWSENNLSALSAQCWPSINQLWNMSVCAVFGRLTAQGKLVACESDTLGALSMLVNYSASFGEKIPHFIDWTIRHRENPNRLLAWHCGNASLCLAKDPDKTALRSRNDMSGMEPVQVNDPSAGLYQFQVKSGPVTFCRLSEMSGDWKMLIASGTAVPSSETLAGTWSWVEVKNHEKLYRTLIENGFIHHASMVHDDQKEILELACKFLDITPVIVE